MTTVGVSDIVIWGYGEIAVGMFVGCLATLRPLFRKVFRLGSLGSSGRSKQASSSPFPTNSRKTYDQFSSHNDIEMGSVGMTSNAFKGPAKSPKEVASHDRASLSELSESDSIEQILEDARKQGMENSIVVSRQVQIAHSKREV